MKIVPHMYLAALFFSFGLFTELFAHGSGEAQTSHQVAPGYGPLKFELPAPGSYDLPPLGLAEDGEVLTVNGETSSLYDIFGDHYVLLNFIYSNCSDVNGCPLASQVSSQLKAEMRGNHQLADNLKLVSLSFDPQRDTPKVMKNYGENFKYAGKAGTWEFLTTASEKSLAPILADYSQDIQKQYSLDGQQTEDFSHILRTFLIDPQKKIRNIYSVSFLHKAVVLNDLNTLFLADKIAPIQPENNNAEQKVLSSNSYTGPGDNKQGYETQDYVTRSRAVSSQKGQVADLLELVREPPLGLPDLPEAQIRSISKEKIALGRQLFFDRRLSINETVSCAMCHVPEQGFTSNELSTAIGIEGRSVRRNSPTIYNVAYAQKLFHDGRESTLEQQVWGPLLAKNEMANASVGQLVDKINSLPEYDGKFEQIFSGKRAGMESIGAALATYQRTLLSANSAFDRWYFGSEEMALDEQQQAGFALFTGKAACANCHTIDEKTALFTDHQLHNTGLGYASSMGDSKLKQRVQLAPGVFVDVDQSVIEKVSEARPPDVGQYEITENPDDRWKYKTPTLRNIALTGPYTHDGRFSSLEQVVRFYNQGGIANDLLSPLIKPLGLDDHEIDALVSFLEALTGDNTQSLVADALAEPTGDRNRLSQRD